MANKAKKKKEELTDADIQALADELTAQVSNVVETDMADEEAIYDSLKHMLNKYLI